MLANIKRWLSAMTSSSPRRGIPPAARARALARGTAKGATDEAASAAVATAAATDARPVGFAGSWQTTFGPMMLTVDAARATGTYGAGNTIEGEIAGDRLDFHYREPSEEGAGFFERRGDSFAGMYRVEGGEADAVWRGTRTVPEPRGFDGLWDTSFGRMRLVREGDAVNGTYDGAGHSTIVGRLEGGRLVFRYQEPKIGGEGWFELDPDGQGFAGEWRPEGTEEWGEWDGKRVVALPGVAWLVVLEAHWQRNLVERDFAFGFMLSELFARVPQVAVRHRFFDNETSLLNRCRELAYLAEPVVLVITSHGEPEGVSVEGQIIDTARIIGALEHAGTLKLLHFSCCLIGQDAGKVLSEPPFPVSGYLTSVDWAQSAMTEFIYLDMILGKGLSPDEAAERLPQLVAFAGDAEIEGSPYAPAGFRYFPPREGGAGA